MNMINEWKSLKSRSKRCNLRSNSKLQKYYQSLIKNKSLLKKNNSSCLKNVKKILKTRIKRLKRQYLKLNNLKWKDLKHIDKVCNYMINDLKSNQRRMKRKENIKKSYFRNDLRNSRKQLRRWSKRKRWKRRLLIPS